MARKKEYVRLRKDSGQHRRILVVGAMLGLLAFVPAALRLYSLMVTNYDFYRRLALENQSRVTRVMGERGEIYDRNMNLLAGNESVENVYLAPLELNQSQADLQALSQTLGGASGGGPEGNPGKGGEHQASLPADCPECGQGDGGCHP